jgi:anti-sigma-K factor RskA
MNGHPTREDDFDLYALGALEGDEKLAIESHVASCAACTEKLAEARGRIALLALAAPQVAPSAAVKQRLMQQVRAHAETNVDRSVAARESQPAPSRTPQRAPRDADRASGFFGRWWAAVLLPAGAVLAVATILLWTENRQLDRELAALRAASQQQQQQLQNARAVADMLESRDTVTISLAQQPGMPVGAAHVMYNSKMGMLMYDGELAPAPVAKSYQLWLVPADGKPISAGVFNPISGRTDHMMMKLPPGIAAKEFAVSLEPAGGMPQPTGPMVLVGPVS